MTALLAAWVLVSLAGLAVFSWFGARVWQHRQRRDARPVQPVEMAQPVEMETPVEMEKL